MPCHTPTVLSAQLPPAPGCRARSVAPCTAPWLWSCRCPSRRAPGAPYPPTRPCSTWRARAGPGWAPSSPPAGGRMCVALFVCEVRGTNRPPFPFASSSRVTCEGVRWALLLASRLQHHLQLRPRTPEGGQRGAHPTSAPSTYFLDARQNANTHAHACLHTTAGRIIRRLPTWLRAAVPPRTTRAPTPIFTPATLTHYVLTHTPAGRTTRC